MSKLVLQGEAERALNIYYEVDNSQEPIGIGGMGQVFVGTRVEIATGSITPVAVKFLYSDLPPRAIERSKREAMVQLRNDNVIQMYGFIETQSRDEAGNVQKRYHVVSELLNGVTLEDLLQGKLTDRNGNIVGYAQELYDIYTKDSVRFAKIVMKSVLSGLMALHDLLFIHRDIDPSNIMITDDRHIKLIDFGICKRMDSLTTGDKSLTVSGRFMGKPHYASPELAVGDLSHQSYTTDIYAVGILLFQCITGHVPFEGPLTDVLDMQVHKPIPLKEIHHAGMRRIIQKACEKNQFKRYQTAAEMRVDIESLDVKRADDNRKKLYIAASVIGLILVIIGSSVGYFIHQKNAEEERIAKIEQMRTDSLLAVVSANVRDAESLANKGYLHDEGFDGYLVNALLCYNNADSAKVQLSEGVECADYSAERDKLIAELNRTKEELMAKADDLGSSQDSSVLIEVDYIRNRIAKIEEVLGK